jgi:hypothetical protein
LYQEIQEEQQHDDELNKYKERIDKEQDFKFRIEGWILYFYNRICAPNSNQIK